MVYVYTTLNNVYETSQTVYILYGDKNECQGVAFSMILSYSFIKAIQIGFQCGVAKRARLANKISAGNKSQRIPLAGKGRLSRKKSA